MKTYVVVLLLGMCLIGIPGVSEAALDWQIRWSDQDSPQTAKVYIFNPEFTQQTFSLEIGDIAATSNTGAYAPYLILGQDVSLRVQPGERKIFDILVYQDSDPYSIYASQGVQTYSLGEESSLILLEGRPSSGNSDQNRYPMESRGLTPVPRPTQEGNEYSYRNERGYWKLILVDHDHVAEQLIRTGNRMGASHTGIQQAVLFYTQGEMTLSNEAKSVWEAALPDVPIGLPPEDPEPCTYSISSQYSSIQTVRIGDVLEARDQGLSSVVAAENFNYTKPQLQVFLMGRVGIPNEQSEYTGIVRHDSQLERIIQTGLTDVKYSNCTIQDVVWYQNKEVGNLTTEGKALWERAGGETSNGGGGVPPCFGGQPATVTELNSAPENWKNLALLFGLVVPFGVIFKRKGRK